MADRHRHALINDQIAALIPWWSAKYFFLISECDIYTETGAYSWDETGERCTFAICSGFSLCKEVKLLIFYRRSLSWASAYHFLSHWLFSSPSSLLILSLSLSDRCRHHHWPKSLFSSTLTPVSVQTPRKNTTPPHERHVAAAATILTWAPSLTCANCSNVLSLHVGGWWWSLPTLLPNAKWSRDRPN